VLAETIGAALGDALVVMYGYRWQRNASGLTLGDTH
jgi:hypothetical protein